MTLKSQEYETFVERDFDRYIGWHQGAVEKPPYQYELCANLTAEHCGTIPDGKLVNLCAANGNLLHFLKKHLSGWQFLGLETSRLLVDHESTASLTTDNLRVEHCESYASGASLHPGEFDVAVHWMRLLHFSDWKEHIAAATKLVRPGGHVLVSSLFNHHDVDLPTVLQDWSVPACRDGYGMQYNTFSGPEVLRHCVAQGFQSATLTPLEFPFDIPRRPNGFGTYTVKSAEGERLQISGGVLMHWQILHIIV